MAEFLVELYAPKDDGRTVVDGADRAKLGAEELTREGTPVRYLRSIFVPEDETCFLLFEAETVDGVQEAARRAELPFERIVESVAHRETEGR